MARTVKVAKWGNNLGVRIPIDVARELRIKPKDSLKIINTDNQIILTVRPSKQERLEAFIDELVAAGIHPDE